MSPVSPSSNVLLPRLPRLAAALFLAVAVPAFTQEGNGLGAQFQRADRDGDGFLSADEVTGQRAALVRSADADGDGRTSLDELRVHLAQRKKQAAAPDPEAKPTILAGAFPEGSPLTPAHCRAAAAYSARQGGYTFLVNHGGKTVFERYDQGWTPERPHRLASGTKSFSAAILALAVKDELLTLDETIATTLTEWESDPRLSQVTYRQLLGLVSGIDPGDNGKVPSYRDAADEARAVHAPGRKFAYGPVPFQVFGEAIRRKLAAREDLPFDHPLAYLEARVFSPIGLSYDTWRRDEDDLPHLPSGAFLAAREWAKYGEFLRLGGTWEESALVDGATLAACLEGSEANPGYGLTLWRLSPGRVATDGAPGTEDEGSRTPGPGRQDPRLQGAYMAAGAGKQRLFVIPELDLVVVRQGESPRFDNATFLSLLLGKPRKEVTPGSGPSR